MKAKLLALLAGLASPVQLTIAELMDRYDESPTTVFQPDLLISAWGTWIVLAIVIFTGAQAVQDARDAKRTLEENDIKPLK